ncbi:hypothetical protein [Sinimarinibacterium thermocellulolyticum]|uniref:Uncharacterized protein n=1 Tax=Sinimarinibacterium thermocellulolyticum TaxID=3170016 RepID=A0ABV2A8U9_9GAMM
MLRIYDETQIRRRLRLKRTQMLTLFCAGAACGLWLAQDGGTVNVADAAVAVPGSGPALATRWCTTDAMRGLRFDCGLASTALTPAEGS